VRNSTDMTVLMVLRSSLKIVSSTGPTVRFRGVAARTKRVTRPAERKGSDVIDRQVMLMTQLPQLHIFGSRLSSTGDLAVARRSTLSSFLRNALIRQAVNCDMGQGGFGTKTALAHSVVVRTLDWSVRTSRQNRCQMPRYVVLRPSR